MRKRTDCNYDKRKRFPETYPWLWVVLFSPFSSRIRLVHSWKLLKPNHIFIHKFLASVRHLLMTYHWLKQKPTTMQCLNECNALKFSSGTAYPSGAPYFTPVFSRFLLLNLPYSVQCYVDHCLSFCSPFCHCIFCLSIYVFSLPLSYLKIFLAVISNINSRCYWRLHFTSSNL